MFLAENQLDRQIVVGFPYRIPTQPILLEDLFLCRFVRWITICANDRLAFAGHELYHKTPKCKT